MHSHLLPGTCDHTGTCPFSGSFTHQWLWWQTHFQRLRFVIWKSGALNIVWLCPLLGWPWDLFRGPTSVSGQGKITIPEAKCKRRSQEGANWHISLQKQTSQEAKHDRQWRTSATRQEGHILAGTSPTLLVPCGLWIVTSCLLGMVT